MKLNNKGFMMAEVIIVSAIIITTMVSLYAGFNRVYSTYNERNTFFSSDGIYALKTFEDFYINEQIMNKIANSLITNDYIDLTNCDNTTYYQTAYQKTLCNQIKNQYKINKIIATTYDLSKIDATINNIDTNEEYNETLKDYLEYYYNNEEIQTANFSYLFFVELITSDSESDEPTYSYANLKIR